MLRFELADNEDSWRTGLMFRKHLPEDAGMLFKFRRPQVLKFWGLNTYIPLDIAFVDDNNTIIKIGRIKDMSMQTVSSEKNCVSVIEANDGYFSENGIKMGHRIEVDNKNNIIKFIK